MEHKQHHIDPVELLPKYLAGEADTEERMMVEAWRDANTDNKKEFLAFSKLWNASASSVEFEAMDIDVEWKKLELAIAPVKAKIISLRRVIQIAASLAIISTLALVGLKYSNTETEKSPIAELKNITLPDGSTVSLNANSKIIYQKGFGTKNRSLTLKGEAYFEVAKNKSIPFIIQANGASIEVVGTKFNVKAYSDIRKVKVLVTEGSVKLYQSAKPSNGTTLSAGESGSFDLPTQTVQKLDISNLNDIAWKTLIVDFNNTSLSDAAAILENTYHVPIEIDPQVQQCLITVHFEKQDLVSILKVLKSTLDLNITTQDDRIMITGPGC
jgi:ferric-dicitrate binding protein FerR (iron transport regulator)